MIIIQIKIMPILKLLFQKAVLSFANLRIQITNDNKPVMTLDC